VVIQQTLRGMARDPLLLLPARQMMPYFSPKAAMYRIPGLRQSDDRSRLEADQVGSLA
jgi:hypothetical protein